MIREVNVIRILHNKKTLQDKLESLGFAKLDWTTNLDHDQMLLASSCEHTKKGGRYYREEIPDKHYVGCFWNGGVGEPRKEGNVYDVGNDEKMFIELAKRIIKEKYIYFDENWNPIETPDFLK